MNVVDINMEEKKIVKHDVGMMEDMMFFLKNMIALEEHLKNSYDLSKDEKYAEYLDFVRKQRTKYLSLIKKEFKNQDYCASKHSLAIAMGLQECGNRFLSTEQLEEALECFKDGNEFEKLFIILNDLDKEVKHDVPKKKSSA